MEAILVGLRELEGVNGTFVSDSAGQIYACLAAAIYDSALLAQVSKLIAGAVDSIRLIQEDWETITTQYSEGRLILRSLRSPAQKGAPPYVLAVVADGRLNLSFATVAIRVAAGKLANEIAANGGTLVAMGTQTSGGPAAGQVGGMSTSRVGPMTPIAAASTALGSSHVPVAPQELAGSGLSWSGLGGSSSLTASGVSVADAASSAVLTACTKHLAKAVGPMAKVVVKDAVRQVCGGQPFAKVMLPVLISEIEKHIEDRDEAAAFRKAASALA